uniref:C2H2-type domain-containing protein n=1 Tax=Eptatretus burgeri TaxID=7764 RepID=A0A8C4QZU6_EPTBU
MIDLAFHSLSAVLHLLCSALFLVPPIRPGLSLLHPAPRPQQLPLPPNQPLFSCTTCSHVFNTKAALMRHREKHHPASSGKTYKCTDYSSSTCHKSVSVNSTQIHTKKSQYSCSVCDKHPYSCKVCGKIFSSSSFLKEHSCPTHISMEPYTCSTGKKLYTCNVCDKKFSYSSKFQNHMRIHTGERPFPCNFCAKTFSNFACLRKHTRTHTGERPYPCLFCGKRYSTSSTLKNHTRIHTGERPYTCTVCEKTFIISSTLKAHSRIHTGERPYTCTFCGKAFSLLCVLHSICPFLVLMTKNVSKKKNLFNFPKLCPSLHLKNNKTRYLL